MTLAERVLARLKSRPCANPEFISLSREAAAICAEIEQMIADQNRYAATCAPITRLPTGYADGVTPQKSVGTRTRAKLEDAD